MFAIAHNAHFSVAGKEVTANDFVVAARKNLPSKRQEKKRKRLVLVKHS